MKRMWHYIVPRRTAEIASKWVNEFYKKDVEKEILPRQESEGSGDEEANAPDASGRSPTARPDFENPPSGHGVGVDAAGIL